MQKTFLCAKTVSFLLLLLFSISSFAQENDEEDNAKINSNRKYKNEAGIDISRFQLLQGYYSAGYASLFFRRHFIKEKAVKSLSGVNVTSYHAYRFRIGSNLSFENPSLPDIKSILLDYNSNYYNYYNNRSVVSNSSFFIRIGKEKQIRSKRFELLYGYDFFYNYSYYSEYWLTIQILNSGQPNLYNINQEYKNEEKSISFGIAPVAGLKYFLIPRLCFSAEATINFGYNSYKETHLYNRFDTSTKEYYHEELPLKVNSFKVSIEPLFAINIGYYF